MIITRQGRPRDEHRRGGSRWFSRDAELNMQLDAIRTASAITVVTGASVTTLLSARRQQSTEQAMEHEREHTAEQRITELYTRAVDQLGAEKAPVRLGALHALEHDSSRAAWRGGGRRLAVRSA